MRSDLLQPLVAAPLDPPVVGARLGIAEVLGEDRVLLGMAGMWVAHYLYLCRMPGTFSGVTLSMKSSSIRIGVAKPQAPRHSTSMTVNLPVGAGGPELAAAGLPEQRLQHILGAADVAGRRGAHLDEVPAHRMGVVHGVERHHALDVRRGEIQYLGHLADGRLGDPAARFLHHPERRQQARLLGGILGEQLLQARPARPDEYAARTALSRLGLLADPCSPAPRRPPLPAAPLSHSSVDLSHDDVHAGVDGDDVGQERALTHGGQAREVDE